MSHGSVQEQLPKFKLRYSQHCRCQDTPGQKTKSTVKSPGTSQTGLSVIHRGVILSKFELLPLWNVKISAKIGQEIPILIYLNHISSFHAGDCFSFVRDDYYSNYVKLPFYTYTPPNIWPSLAPQRVMCAHEVWPHVER